MEEMIAESMQMPLTILKRRYAAGEIDADQFSKMKVQLAKVNREETTRAQAQLCWAAHHHGRKLGYRGDSINILSILSILSIFRRSQDDAP